MESFYNRICFPTFPFGFLPAVIDVTLQSLFAAQLLAALWTLLIGFVRGQVSEIDRHTLKLFVAKSTQGLLIEGIDDVDFEMPQKAGQ